MGTDYSIAVIGAGEDLPRRLKAVGYCVYRFENRDALARFSGREFLDLIVDAEKAVAILPGGAALPLSPPPEKAIAGAILRLPVTEEFSPELALTYLNGNYRVYGNILKRYLKAYGNLEETLRGYLAGEEFPAIGAVIHKIKGVSLNIGSRKLYRFCGFLEERIAKKPNAEDFDIFIRFHRRIIEHCKEQGEKCLQTQKI